MPSSPSFHLTLTLSRGAREQAAQSSFRSAVSERAAALDTILPLPKGEGRGEGKGIARSTNHGLARVSHQPCDGAPKSCRPSAVPRPKPVTNRRSSSLAFHTSGEKCGLALRILLACSLALLLTGCFWTRLLAVKNQLGEFERYVRVDDQGGLALEFLKPVLYSSDVHALFDADPTVRSTNGNRVSWRWTFEKLTPTNTTTPEFSISFSTIFENDKLCRLTIPDRFKTIMSKETILAMARSVGKGKVDQKKRALDSDLGEGDLKDEMEPISKAQMLDLLGPPWSAQESKGVTTLFYEYLLKSATPEQAKNKPVRFRCRFAKGSDKLTRADFSYNLMRVGMTFNPPSPKASKAPQ
jgi:hypothetical protein